MISKHHSLYKDPHKKFLFDFTAKISLFKKLLCFLQADNEKHLTHCVPLFYYQQEIQVEALVYKFLIDLEIYSTLLYNSISIIIILNVQVRVYY